jgi:hypothetical protein
VTDRAAAEPAPGAGRPVGKPAERSAPRDRARRIAAAEPRGSRAAASPIDWTAVARAHRDGRAIRLRAGRRLAISPERAFAAAVAASAPFRIGTRFRAAPDVQFFAGDDLVRAPGDRLPGPDDRSLDAYVARVAAAEPAPFQLVVTHPLVVDFALWAEVRDLVRGLFAQIGAPVLPVVGELVLGTFRDSPRGFAKRMHCAAVTVVLAGRLRARLWRRLWQPSPNEIRGVDGHPPDATLTARAGDVLYWPADRWHLDEAIGPCLALRLWIPGAGSDVTSGVAQALGELVADRLDAAPAGAVPYAAVARPSSRGARATRTTAPRPLRDVGRELGELARGPELARELAIQWVRRVSACGLEPVPPARPIALPAGARVRRDPRTPIVEMRWRGESIWAANGHGFALRRGGRALRRMLTALERGDAEVDALCGDAPGLRVALELLAEVGALVVAPPGGAGRGA